MYTRVAAYVREVVSECAALEELVGHCAHDGTPVAVRRGEALLVRGVKVAHTDTADIVRSAPEHGSAEYTSAVRGRRHRNAARGVVPAACRVNGRGDM